jgi:predicted nucleic acid-binding protein
LLLEVGSARRRRAFELFRKLAPDTPRLSFTDCTSFAVMLDTAIRHAFTVDRHFRRAGRGVRPLFERVGNAVRFVPPS